ncbi:MAG: hypothetical protein AAF401_18430 [Pseudomonadota bacterium]
MVSVANRYGVNFYFLLAEPANDPSSPGMSLKHHLKVLPRDGSWFPLYGVGKVDADELASILNAWTETAKAGDAPSADLAARVARHQKSINAANQTSAVFIVAAFALVGIGIMAMLG